MTRVAATTLARLLIAFTNNSTSLSISDAYDFEAAIIGGPRWVSTAKKEHSNKPYWAALRFADHGIEGMWLKMRLENGDVLAIGSMDKSLAKPPTN